MLKHKKLQGGKMRKSDLVQRFETEGVIHRGHFVYKSGLHGPMYVNKDQIFADPKLVRTVCGELAKRAPFGVDVVVGPAVGGAILAHRTASRLSKYWQKTVYSAFADKEGDGFVLKRGYDELVCGRRVLVVEDVVTTGGSVKKVISAIREAGGEVVCCVAICNRGNVSASDIGAPVFAFLLSLKLDGWPEEQCELCREGMPINTTLGHGKEYLRKSKLHKIG